MNSSCLSSKARSKYSSAFFGSPLFTFAFTASDTSAEARSPRTTAKSPGDAPRSLSDDSIASRRSAARAISTSARPGSPESIHVEPRAQDVLEPEESHRVLQRIRARGRDARVRLEARHLRAGDAREETADRLAHPQSPRSRPGREPRILEEERDRRELVVEHPVE